MPVREMGMWVVMLTRPDMAFCTVHLASCASAWTDESYQALSQRSQVSVRQQ